MRLLTLLLALLALPAFAQTPVSGRVLDAADDSSLPSATVLATRLSADSLQRGVAADLDGRFTLNLPAGPYRLVISFAGYQPDIRTLEVGTEPIALGDIRLQTVLLDEVQVGAVRQRVEVRGDTTAFNAEAFQVNPDASVEDLVAKLPGVVVQDGEVQAQGQTVQRVLVDGEEFFGSDPSAALRNLPAEIVKEIQVYERQSDQSEFTGFDDGNGEITINVVTRADRRAGQFGRLFGGLGGAMDPAGNVARYSTGGAVHAFDGTRRISVIGIANNINEQNFAAEDLAGVLEGGGGGRGRRGGRGGGGDAGTYLVGEQPGVTNTSALGINYTDRIGDGVRVQGSYFLNRTGNLKDAFTSRDYVIGEALTYAETDAAETTNWNHRFSGQLRADLSESTQFTLRPRLSLQTGSTESLLTGRSTLADALAGLTSTDYAASRTAYTSSADLFLRHRLPTRGRTLSLGLNVGLNGDNSDTDQDVLTLAYTGTGADTTDAFQRQIASDGTDRSVRARLTYTEPLGEGAQLQVNYSPGISTADGDQQAFRLDPATGLYTVVDSTFTSLSDQRVVTQRGGVDVRYNTERLRLSAGLDGEYQSLTYDQGGPLPFAVDRTTTSFLPSLSARYEITEEADLDLRYRSSTRTPGVTQLRSIVDDSNPLLVTTGNPDLETAREHRVDLRLRATQPQAGSVLFGSVQLQATQDYIGSAVTVAGNQPVVVDGITLSPGAQLTRPVNLDGYLRARAFGTVGRPISFLKSNANATLGATYTRTPSLYNGVENRADALALDGRLFVGTSFSERFDASLSYGASWTGVTNSARTSSDDTYVRHRGTAELTWLPWTDLVLSSDFSINAYTGLDTGIAPTTAVWNASGGYKFLPSNLAEVRLSMNDLLNQNTGLVQTVTDTYVETARSQALGRYAMLSLSYKLRSFGSGGSIPEAGEGRRGQGFRGDGPRRGDGPPLDRD